MLPGWAALVLGAPLIIGFCFLVAYPAIQLVVTSFSNGFADYRALFHGAGLRALRTTLTVSLLVTAITLLIGAVIGWTLRTTRSRLVAALFWIGVMGPISMSVVVKNFVFITVLGRFGALNWILEKFDRGQVSYLFTPTAVTIGMVYSLFPFAVLPLYLTFKSIPDELLQASASLGGRPAATARTVVAPLAAPGFFVTGVLLFVLSIGFFVAPVVLGGPRSSFLASLIRADVQVSFDQAAASAKAVFLIVVALALIACALMLVGRRRFERALG